MDGIVSVSYQIVSFVTSGVEIRFLLTECCLM
jgi:hypothetical protein